MDKNKKPQAPLIMNPISQNPESINSMFTKNLLIFLVIAIILGGLTGYLLSNKKQVGVGNVPTSGSVDNSKITKGTIVGSNDTATFKDTTSGTLQNGGIDGEGQFHLVRLGGDSQNVYLVSSSVDLAKFVGKKIKVWGQTQTAQHAGWLMDVGRVEVLD